MNISDQRIILFQGHYGSGKTNVAVNYAKELHKIRDHVMIADLDIVNPYFRTTDSRAELEAEGIQVIASPYAGSNVDLPSLSDETYAIIDKKDYSAVIDVGGDDRGAYALGRFADAIQKEQNYDNFLVINCYRPLSRKIEDLLQIKSEIEAAGGIPFTGIVNNSNLGTETTPEDLLRSMDYAQRVSEITGLKIVFTAAERSVGAKIGDRITNLFSMTLQNKII